jgi:hypothetical protein
MVSLPKAIASTFAITITMAILGLQSAALTATASKVGVNKGFLLAL